MQSTFSPLAGLRGRYPAVQLPRPAASDSFLGWATKASWLVLVVASLYQLLFHPSLPNFIAIGTITVAWALFTSIFFRAEILGTYPLSTLMILGFTTTQLYFPLVFTSLEGKSIVFNLEFPYLVFLHSSAAMVVIILSHALYRSLRRPRAGQRPTILLKLGFFTVPTDAQVWLIGFVGVAATFYTYLYQPTGWSVTGAASDKAVQSLLPFTYAPFCLPFKRLYGSTEKPTMRLLLPLAGFTLLLFLVSIGRNSRGGFMVGFASVGFAYILGLLLGVYKARFFTLRNAILAVGAFWFFTGPVADIGTAMVLVREQRHDISYAELISNTLAASTDKAAIEHYRSLDAADDSGTNWDENYLKNIFLARFCNIKFNDLSLGRAEKYQEYDPRMRTYALNYILAELPQPALDALDLTSVDKTALKGGSIGDYLYYLTDGPPWVIGWYLTGHFAGTSMATFGWWYLLLLGVGLLPVYLLFDKLFLRDYNAPTAAGAPSFRFSLCGLIMLDIIFRFFPMEHVINIPVQLVRALPQLLLTYLLLFYVTRLVARLLPGGRSPKRSSYVRRPRPA